MTRSGRKCGERMSRLENTIHEQNAYISASGGILNIKESDDTFNDLNREQITDMLEEHGKVFLGKINVSDENARKQILDGGSPYTKYTGGFVKNFSCDFAVPKADKELASLLRCWVDGDTAVSVLDEITEKVSSLGGVMFIWT